MKLVPVSNIKISKLKKQRIMARMSQAELASASGVPIKCIGNYEQMRRDINHAQVQIVYRLAAAIGCDMLDLLDVEELYKK